MIYSYTNCPSIHHTNLYEHNHTARVHMYIYTLLYSGNFQGGKVYKFHKSIEFYPWNVYYNLSALDDSLNPPLLNSPIHETFPLW